MQRIKIFLFAILVALATSCVPAVKQFNLYHAKSGFRLRWLANAGCDSVYVLIRIDRKAELFSKVHKKEVRYTRTSVKDL